MAGNCVDSDIERETSGWTFSGLAETSKKGYGGLLRQISMTTGAERNEEKKNVKVELNPVTSCVEWKSPKIY